MMPSDALLLGSVKTSVFHGFGAWKSWPGTVVVVADPVVVVVLGRDVDELVLGRDVEVDVDEVLGRDVLELDDVDDDVVVELVVAGIELDVVVVVGFVLDVEEVDDVVAVELLELDDVLVVGTRVDEVLVVDVDVVVVFRLRAAVAVEVSLPQTHATHASPPAQSAAISHSSPAAASIVPSPQVDFGATKSRRFAPRARNVPLNAVHASSTFAFSRTPRSEPHAAQRA